MSVQGKRRLGIAGATSMIGKELAEELPESALAAASVVLLDEEEAAGQLTTVGDEPAVISSLDEGAFDGLEFVFFTGPRQLTRESWKQARQAGAGVLDLSYGLDGEREVLVRSPWVRRELQANGRGSGVADLDLTTAAVVPAHPVAVMLALVLARLSKTHQVRSAAATVLLPASEEGRAGMDELHQQTVSLLSFQTLPKAHFDAQVAFNLIPELGSDAIAEPLAEVRRRVARHYRLISGGSLPELTLEVVQAPVFHGVTASVLVELTSPATEENVREALTGAHVEVTAAAGEAPNNIESAGQRGVSASVRGANETGASGRVWLWLAADNLRLHASHSIACAVELGQLRPRGTVQ